MAAAVRMNIQMLLEAADYLERRERGARGPGGVQPEPGPGPLRSLAAGSGTRPLRGWLEERRA